jgi:hypothetical protein
MKELAGVLEKGSNDLSSQNSKQIDYLEILSPIE